MGSFRINNENGAERYFFAFTPGDGVMRLMYFDDVGLLISSQYLKIEETKRLRDYLNDFLWDSAKDMTAEINRAAEEIVRRNGEKMVEQANEDYNKWVKGMISQDERISNIEKKLEADHEAITWLTAQIHDINHRVDAPGNV